MTCNDIKMMISSYIDNELPKGEEGFLFTHIAACSGCREEFKVQTQIQHEIKINRKEVSEKFEERVFNSMRERETTFTKRWITKPVPVYINYVLGVVLVAIMFFSFIQIVSLRQDLNLFQERYEASLRQMNYQASQMYLMMNSMPAVEIKQY